MPSERERMVRGDPYDPSAPDLVAERRTAHSLCDWYNETGPEEGMRRTQLLGELFGTLGEGCTVEPPFQCDYGWNIHVGEAFFANYDCVVLDVCPVHIGDHVQFGPGVHIYTATHPLDAAQRRAGIEWGESVTVGDDVWVGGRAVITPGVTVGDRAVIGAGAVVVEDVPPDTMVAGVPARVVREL